MIKTLLSIFLIAFLPIFSCNYLDRERSLLDRITGEKGAASGSFVEQTFSRSDIRGLSGIEGDLYSGRRWNDANGENIVVFSWFYTSQDTEVNTSKSKIGDTLHLRAYHFLRSKNAHWQLICRVADHEVCDRDWTLYGGFIPESIAVTDLDDNNIGEVSFVYIKACITGISPFRMKAMMLEDSVKYIAEGTTIIDYGYGEVAGKKEVTYNSALKETHQEFRSHFNQLWDTWCVHSEKYSEGHYRHKF